MAVDLLVFGLGYSGTEIARQAVAANIGVSGTSRSPLTLSGVKVVPFADAAEALATATHVVSTVPPTDAGDPVLAAYGPALRGAPKLRWAGYLSTTGVYGDRGGGWVDEDTPVAPGSDRARRRVAVETEWAMLADRIAVDLFRVAGIYGPGRSALDDVRSGRARRILKPGHEFGRIHRDDIAQAVLAAARQHRAPGLRVLHLADDEPAESAAVIEEAARLLGVPAPPALPYAEAAPAMSDMARSFWAENRKVSAAKTRAALGIAWRYPSYREGLDAILRQERLDAAQQQGNILRP